MWTAVLQQKEGLPSGQYKQNAKGAPGSWNSTFLSKVLFSPLIQSISLYVAQLEHLGIDINFTLDHVVRLQF